MFQEVDWQSKINTTNWYPSEFEVAHQTDLIPFFADSNIIPTVNPNQYAFSAKFRFCNLLVFQQGEFIRPLHLLPDPISAPSANFINFFENILAKNGFDVPSGYLADLLDADNTHFPIFDSAIVAGKYPSEALRIAEVLSNKVLDISALIRRADRFNFVIHNDPANPGALDTYTLQTY